jgi:hypothetical protein
MGVIQSYTQPCPGELREEHVAEGEGLPTNTNADWTKTEYSHVIGSRIYG